MTYSLCFNLVGLIIDFLLLLKYRNITKYPYKVYKLYIYMLDAVTVYTLSYFIAYGAEYQKEYVGIKVLYGSQLLYFVSLFSTFVIFGIYILSLVNIGQKRITEVVFVWVPYIIAVVSVCLTPWTKMLFFYDGGMSFHRSGIYLLAYGLGFYYLIFSEIIFILNDISQHKINRRTYSIIVLSVLVLLIAFALQYVFDDFAIAPFVFGFVLLVFMCSNKSPMMYLDDNHTVGFSTFLRFIKISFKTSNEFSIYVVNIKPEDKNVNSSVEHTNDLKLISDYFYSLGNHIVVCMYSWDTFLIMTDKLDFETDISNILMDRFKRVWEFSYGKQIFKPSIAVINCPHDCNTPDRTVELIKLVAGQLKVGKVRFANLGDEINRRNDLISAIKKAMINGSFMVYYQPIYSVKEHTIVAAEALIRLKDDKLGFISPEEFIPIAEEEGYIHEIGRFVFEEVCRFFSHNHLSDMGIDYIEINLSVVQCMEYNIVQRYLHIIDKYGIDHKKINCEITETAAIESHELVRHNIKSMCNNGILLSLDDYGTGYSNFSYIVDLPFDYIKIDKGLLWSSMDDENADIILRNLTNMIHRLNLKTIVEGVETLEQINKLIDYKCEYLQGYYFSRPVAGDDFIRYISEFKDPLNNA